MTQSKTLFQLGNFTLHNGQRSRVKIDCDALSLLDWETLAYMGIEKMGWPNFSTVLGIPEGGRKLAAALGKYQSDTGGVLIVDDVLTTGASMRRAYSLYPRPETRGLVVFARGACPAWITPIFQM